MAELIKLAGISKYYTMGEEVVKAVDDMSLEINKGDFVAIMGASGSGKSTSMNLVGSLDMPTKGKIFLEGHDISLLHESEIAQLRGKKIGFIFQSFNLIPNLSAKENVMLPMVFQSKDKQERERKSEEILHNIGLSDRMDHYPNELSGGQQQRVAIARALANDPEIILADEPTGNLDTSTGEKVMSILKKLNDEGKTIIIVTHDPELAEKNAKKIYWMKDGKIDRVTEKKKERWVNLMPSAASFR